MDPLIHIGIAHRFQIFNESLCASLMSHRHFQVTGTAQTSQEALGIAKMCKVDVMLLDPFFEDKDALDLVSELLAHNRDLRLIILMMEPRLDYAHRLLRAGALGLISPQCDQTDLAKAILMVYSGRKSLPPLFSKEILENHEDMEREQHRPLTNREVQVLTLIAQGKSKPEIAQKLYISIKTVDTHRANLKEKLGLRNNMEMVLYAVRHGYVRA